MELFIIILVIVLYSQDFTILANLIMISFVIFESIEFIFGIIEELREIRKQKR